MTPISRRSFLASAAAVAVAACSGDEQSSDTSGAPTTTITEPVAPATSTSTTTTTTLPPIDLPSDPFTLGVASGDPDAESVVLWTRLAPSPLDGGGMPDDDVRVQWEVSADENFATLVAVGSEVAVAEHAHSVHALATLPQGSWYYRFRVGDYISPTGLTRVAPVGDVAEVRFATASCQHYASGFYSAHRDIAERAPDFTLFLGDYIYEDAGATNADPDDRTHLGPEPTTLDDYRNRYARYKSDENLQAAHASCPWFVIWDDHEVENNYAGLVPQSEADASKFGLRRFAAYRAWWEHQPVRLAPPTAQDGEYQIYRDAKWGELLLLSLLDGRQYRSDQACGDISLRLEPPCPEVADPDRTMLGTEQEQWLLDTLSTSTAKWKAIGNQVVISNAMFNGAILNFDQWDGYPAARDRLLSRLTAAEIENLVVLTGDIHLAAVGHIHHDDIRVGVEFVTTSISSGGNIPAEFTDVLKEFPDFVDAELAHRGYTLHTVTPEQWTAEYRIVTDVLTPNSEVTTFRSYVVSSGSGTAEIVEQP